MVELPTPSRISYIWNLGSLLGLSLSIQIFSGAFLAIHYGSDIIVAFSRVGHIMRDVNLGWLYRAVHANGARFFFICLYAHVARGLYYGSFILNHVWIVGCSILLASIATAFFGYVLPWGQISFWGTAVITNLFSVLPYIGKRVVTWLWGGFAAVSYTHLTLPTIYSV